MNSQYPSFAQIPADGFSAKTTACHEAGGELERIAWPRLSTNDKALPGICTTFSKYSERQHRPGTGLIMGPIIRNSNPTYRYQSS